MDDACCEAWCAATHWWLIDPGSAACTLVHDPTFATNIVVNTRPSVTRSITVSLRKSERAGHRPREPQQSDDRERQRSPNRDDDERDAPHDSNQFDCIHDCGSPPPRHDRAADVQ